jgi:ankyrin repeat protein
MGNPLYDLLNACEKGNYQKCVSAINEGADVNGAKRTDGLTPLILATRGGHSTIVDFLIEKGADPELLSLEGESPLINIFAKCTPDNYEKLLEYKPKLNLFIQDKKGRNILMFAIKRGNVEFFEKIRDRFNEFNKFDIESKGFLHYASLSGNNVIGKYLIEQGCDVNMEDNQGDDPIIIAAEHGHIKFIQMLIENNANTKKI